MKTPYYIRLTSGTPFACAGIWEPSSTRSRGVPRFAILTVAANTLVSTIHDRMPVMLDERDERAWISLATSHDDVTALIAPFNAAALTMYQVSPQVNSSRFESPSAIEPVGEIYGEGRRIRVGFRMRPLIVPADVGLRPAPAKMFL